MATVYSFDQYRTRRAAPTIEDFPVVEGELLPPGPPPPGAAVVKARPALPGVRALPPAIRVHAGRAGRVVIAQSLRVVHPVTIGRATRITVRGAGRLTIQTVRYLAGKDKTELRVAKPEKHHELVKARQQGALIVAVAAALGLFLAPAVVAYLAAGLLVLTCAGVGRQGEKVLADAPSILGGSESVVRQAFIHARLAKAPEDVKLVSPVQHTGNGWTVTVDLPPGETGDRAVSRRPQLASALGVCTAWLTVTPDRKRNQRITVAAYDHDPFDRDFGINPLAGDPRPVDLWDGVVVGADETGRPVTVPLVFSGLLVGGMPRMGKTNLVNNVLASTLLDRHAQLWLVDGKGIDSRPLIPYATRHCGPDVEDFAQLMADLVVEMDRRADRIADAGLDKLSKELCHKEMPLIVLSVDELARYTTDTSKEAKQAIADLRTIVSVGPACGIIPVLATQKPEAKVVPSAIRDLIRTRLAVYCATYQASDTILGDGAATKGTDASELDPETPGVAWMVGATRHPLMLRGYVMGPPELRAVADAAARLRTAAGKEVPAVLVRALAAMGDADRMRSQDLAEALSTTVDDLAALLRQHGVRPRQLGQMGADKNPRGYRRADIHAAT